MVPWPTISSPAYRHAIWPGAVRSAGSLSATSTPRARRPRRAPARRHGRQRAAVAHLDRVDAAAVAVQRHVAHAHASRVSSSPRGPTVTVFERAIGREHVQRLARAVQAWPRAQPAALADGDACGRRRARPGRARRGRRSGPDARAQAAVAGEEVASGGCRPGSTGPGSRAGARPADRRARRCARTSGLVSSPSGKRRRASDSGESAPERVALVLAPDRRPSAAAARARAHRRGHARVVAGRERRRAQPVGEVEHRVEAHGAVAAHARIRRQAGRVVGRATVRPRRRGTRRAGRSRSAAGRARARARARRARPAPSSS